MFPLLFETIRRDAVISFPMLGNLTLNPPASFSLFGRDIYFYGVIIALGFVLGTLYAARNARHFGLKADDVYDYMLWTIPMSIIGARLYYVAFRLPHYLEHPSEIFAIWEGGLAIYGGVIAGVIVAVIMCRRRRLSLPAMLDTLVYGLLIGQIIGRWGNFMNREAFGAETDIFCRMGLSSPDGSVIFVHPTFLYESLWNLAGLIFLIVFRRRGRRKYDGQCLLIYLFWYGLGRAWIEGLRTDSLYIGSTGIRVSQALSIVLVLISLTVMLIQSRRPHDPEKLFVNRVRAAEAAGGQPEAESSDSGNNETKNSEKEE